MNVLIPTKIVRYVFAAMITFFAVGHLMNADAMAGMAPFGGAIIIYITGVCLLAAAVSFFINKQGRLAGYLLAVFLLLTAFLVHMAGMNAAEDEMAKSMAMSNMVKDIAMAAAAVAFGNMSTE